jgi:hypothetical protein
MGATITQRRARTSRQTRAVVTLTVIWIVRLAVMVMARQLPNETNTGASAIDSRTTRTAPAGEQPRVSTPSVTSTGAITDLRVLASSTDTEFVGRAVDIKRALINTVASTGGFWLDSKGDRMFVLTADETHFTRGQRVNLRGVVLQLPDEMKNRLDDYPAARDETIYIYATQVRAVT